MKRTGCIALGLLIIGLVLLVVAVEAFFIQIGWNYVIVEGLNIATTKMTFKVAVVAAISLSFIGSMFKSTSSPK